MTATALYGMRCRSNTGAVALAYVGSDRAHTFAQVGEKYVDDIGDKLRSQFIAFGELGNRPHVDRRNDRRIVTHKHNRFKLRAVAADPPGKSRPTLPIVGCGGQL